MSDASGAFRGRRTVWEAAEAAFGAESSTQEETLVAQAVMSDVACGRMVWVVEVGGNNVPPVLRRKASDFRRSLSRAAQSSDNRVRAGYKHSNEMLTTSGTNVRFGSFPSSFLPSLRGTFSFWIVRKKRSEGNVRIARSYRPERETERSDDVLLRTFSSSAATICRLPLVRAITKKRATERRMSETLRIFTFEIESGRSSVGIRTESCDRTSPDGSRTGRSFTMQAKTRDQGAGVD